MFEIESIKGINTNKLTKGNNYDYVTRTSVNQGILRSTGFIDKVKMNEANTWSLELLQMNFFYRKRPWYAGQFIRKIIPKINIPNSCILFFTTILNKQKDNLLKTLIRNVNKQFNNTIIKLPIKDNKIDFKFMDSFVAELEAQRVAELEAYLETTGLNDYELTDEEKKVLSLSEKTASNEVRHSADNAKNETIKFKPFKLGELFKSQTGDVDLQQKDINGKGVYFVNSGNTNYGIKGKTDRKAKIFLKNTITIDFFGNAYYRNYEYKLATHNHVFSLSGNVIKNHLVGQYLISTMQYLTKIYGYSLMATWTKLKENEIKLPVTENGKINFDYMEKYITAIEKLTIKNVVEYKDRLIEQTKKLVD